MYKKIIQTEIDSLKVDQRITYYNLKDHNNYLVFKNKKKRHHSNTCSSYRGCRCSHYENEMLYAKFKRCSRLGAQIPRF